MVQETLQKIFRENLGILAADERPSSMDRRLESYGIAPGESMRNQYRSILFSTPNIERYVSGVILSEDTFSEHRVGDVLSRDYLANLGIAVGVKVDEGLAPYTPDESELHITKGLESLREKCAQYKKEGAVFTKWRATIPVTPLPDGFLTAVAENMATYASVVLKHDLVPIVEPEVLLEGSHTIDEAAETLEQTIRCVHKALQDKGCNPHHCILKTSFATAGLSADQPSSDVVSKKTLEVFKSTNLDSDKGFFGIVFLSGGLPSDTAIEYIQHIRAVAEDRETEHAFRPPLTFSYGRALQDMALKEWGGNQDAVANAQIAFTQTLQHATKKYKGMVEAPEAGDGK